MAVSNDFESVQQLDLYIRDIECWLDSTISTLGMTKELIMEEDLVKCPTDSNHTMPASSLQRHQNYCALRKRGYTDEEIDEENGSEFFYKKARTVVRVKLDMPTIQAVCGFVSGDSAAIPEEMSVTAERYTREFTQAQRLKIYEHVIQEAKTIKKQDEISEEQYSFLTEDLVKKQKKAEQQKPKSHLELLAMKRDMKRRRQSYKGKSYSAKKSHKQIIADVIHNQTEMLREMWTKEHESVAADKHASQTKSTSRRCDRSRSRDRNQSHDRWTEHMDIKEYENSDTKQGARAKRRKRSRSGSRKRSPGGKKKKSKKHRSRSREREHRKKDKDKKRDKDDWQIQIFEKHPIEKKEK